MMGNHFLQAILFMQFCGRADSLSDENHLTKRNVGIHKNMKKRNEISEYVLAKLSALLKKKNMFS